MIGGLATAGAQLAVRYVNDVNSAASAVIRSPSSSASSSRTRRKARPAVRSSSTTSGSASSRRAPSPRERSRSSRRSAARSRSSPVSPPLRSTERRRTPSSSSATHRTSCCRSATTRRTSSTPRPPRSIYPNAVGVADAGQVIAAGLKTAGINTKQVGYTQGQTDLTAPLDRGRGDDGGLHRPVRIGLRLREPGEVDAAARHHRLAQDHDGAALPQLAGDRRRSATGRSGRTRSPRRSTATRPTRACRPTTR